MNILLSCAGRQSNRAADLQYCKLPRFQRKNRKQGKADREHCQRGEVEAGKNKNTIPSTNYELLASLLCRGHRTVVHMEDNIVIFQGTRFKKMRPRCGSTYVLNAYPRWRRLVVILTSEPGFIFLPPVTCRKRCTRTIFGSW